MIPGSAIKCEDNYFCRCLHKNVSIEVITTTTSEMICVVLLLLLSSILMHHFVVLGMNRFRIYVDINILCVFFSVCI